MPTPLKSWTQLHPGCLRDFPATIASPAITLSQPPARKTLLFFHPSSFSSSSPGPTELPNCPRKSVRLTKLEDQRKRQAHPAVPHAAFGIPCAQGPLMSLWACTNTALFFPLNHLGVKLLSARSSPIQAANRTLGMTLPGTTNQRPGRMCGDVKPQVNEGGTVAELANYER